MAGTIDKKPYGYNGYMDFSRLWDALERKGHNKKTINRINCFSTCYFFCIYHLVNCC